MSFANLWGLLALAGIPLVLYLHRRRPVERRLVPLVALWNPGASGASQGSRRRIIDPILLVRLLIVIGIAVGLARPGWPVQAPRRHVVLLDASASMGAREEGGVRLHRAAEAAAHLLRQIPVRDEVMILRGGRPPTLVHAFSHDRASLEAAMRAVAPGEAPKDLLPALAMAATALDGAGGIIHVFSDLREPEALSRLRQRLGLPEEAVRLHAVGGPAGNVGIVRLDAAPLVQSPLDYEVFVAVVNFSGEARAVELSLHLPDGLHERRRLSLAAGERRQIMFSVPLVQWVEARLEGARDALTADDRATLLLSAGPLMVLYVSRQDRFLDAVLRAHSGLRIQQMSLHQFRSARWARSSADVAIVDGATLPEDFPLPALVLGGGEPGGSRVPRGIPVAEWQRGHPLLRELDLSEVFVPAGAVLAPDLPGVVARSAEGAVARVSVGAGPRRVEIAFPVDRSNLGQTPAFPILVARVLEWLVERRAVSPLTLQAGEPLRVAWPDAPGGNLTIRRPDGSVARAIADQGYLNVSETELTGRYEVEGSITRLTFAVNLLDPEESNVDRRSRAVADPARPAIAGAAEHYHIDRWIFAVALQLLSVEIWLLQRRAQQLPR